MENKKKHQKTLKLLLLTHSICVLAVFFVAIILTILVSPQIFGVAFGAFLGGLGGVALILSMSYSIQQAVQHETQSAQKYMLKHYFIRLLIMIGMLLLGVFQGKWLLLGISLGLLCVKIAGFLEPKLERSFFKSLFNTKVE